MAGLASAQSIAHNAREDNHDRSPRRGEPARFRESIGRGRGSSKHRHAGSSAAERSDGGGHERRLCSRSGALGEPRGRCAVPRFQASRHAHERRRHPLAPWRFRATAPAPARQSTQSRDMAWPRCAACAALSRGASRSTRLRRQFAARTRPQPHQLQFPRDGAGHGRGHGESRPSTFFFSPATTAARARATACASITQTGS